MCLLGKKTTTTRISVPFTLPYKFRFSEPINFFFNFSFQEVAPQLIGNILGTQDLEEGTRLRMARKYHHQ